LWLVPSGIVILIVSESAGVIFMGLVIFAILVTDTFFSVVITRAFLRPVYQTLRSAKSTRSRRGSQSGSRKLIERTKWTSLAGVSLVVISSSVLYVNLVLIPVFPDTVVPSPWLNPFVFTANVDSILNNVGMLLVSGTLASALSGNAKRKVYRISSASSGERTAAAEEMTSLVKSRLEEIANTPIETDAFIPPQEQPRCVQLKKIAQLIEEEMFHGDNGDAPRTMDGTVADLLDNDFEFAAQAFFEECVEASTDLVPEMRAQYHGVRRGHLNIYQDTLGQIRQEPQFVELQRRSVKLVQDCTELGRPAQQSSKSISGLYCSGEAVSQRYGTLMTTIASKTHATFHKAGLKGLVRTCEKIFLTAGARNGKTEIVCDVVRGTIECKDFTTMINVQRLLCDLDADLSITGQTGGISESICISRCKNRFGEPTSGGWADIMFNFYFEDDEAMHICELQLVHSQMYTVRKEMGAHTTYSTFRAALELMEMQYLDPEMGSDAEVLEMLDALVWRGAADNRRESLVRVDWKVQSDTLRREVRDLQDHAKVQDAKIASQDAKITSQDATIAMHDAKFAALEAQILQLSSVRQRGGD
jgi:hypothetical protein